MAVQGFTTGTLLWCGLLGMLGGVANSLLLDDGFALPRMVRVQPDRRVWKPGFLGNLILGFIAALAVFLLGGSALPFANQLGVSLVSGVGGGNLLTSLLQKQEATLMKAQLAAMEQTINTLAKK